MPSFNEDIESSHTDEIPITLENKQEPDSPKLVTEHNVGAAPPGYPARRMSGNNLGNNSNQRQNMPNGNSVRPRIPRSSVSRASQNPSQEQMRRNREDQTDASVREIHGDQELYSGYSNLPPLPIDETEQQGYSLFAGFVEQQYQDMGEVLPRQCVVNTPSQQEIGRMLRTIADSFQDTRGRQQVKSMAEAVDITNIGWDTFSNLCDVIFEGTRGVTPERIISLFFFFIDAAKTQAKKYVQDHAKQMIFWAITYILKKVCKSVQAAGGWMVVLRQSIDMVYKAAISAVCVLAAVALSTYIVKSWSSSS